VGGRTPDRADPDSARPRGILRPFRLLQAPLVLAPIDVSKRKACAPGADPAGWVDTPCEVLPLWTLAEKARQSLSRQRCSVLTDRDMYGRCAKAHGTREKCCSATGATRGRTCTVSRRRCERCRRGTGSAPTARWTRSHARWGFPAPCLHLLFRSRLCEPLRAASCPPPRPSEPFAGSRKPRKPH
jgi:hypothetical protein